MNQTIKRYIYSIPKKHEREKVFEYLEYLMELIKSSDTITIPEIELLEKCYIVSSFIGFDNRNHINYSLDGLKFLYEHKNELKQKVSLSNIHDICFSYDLFVILNKKEPGCLLDIRDLYESASATNSGLTLKDLK